MFDYKGIRDNADAYWQNIRDRNVRGADPYRVGELYDRFREITQGINGMQTELNHASKEISLAKRRKDEGSLDRGAEELTERAAALKQKIKGLHAELQEVEAQLAEEASKIPNLTHPGVPVGDESQAREIYRYGGSASREAEEVHDHYDLALGLGIADISAGARVAGSRFHYWTGAGVLLEQALVQFTLQRAIERGYVPYAVPEMARADIVGACGFRPRNTHYSSEDGGSSSSEPSQIYQVRPVAVEAHEADNAQNPLCMIATAEIPLVAYHAGRVFNYPPPDMMRPAEKGGPGQARAWMPEQGLQNEALPVRMVGVSHCFRAEAGARGRDTRGLYRLHQFTKVELVALTTRHHSDAMLEEIREVQESIFRDLGLTFRVLDMPTQELGNAAYRKYDIEAWMPGRNGWGEISSASNCTDYQSRRLGIRYRSNEVEEGEGEGKRRKHRSLQF
ncbi:seryl-tRNA synthetase, partial [Spiromyces aspiralis]